MVRAGSLYFALFISFIVTVILGSLIIYASYSNRYTDAQVMRDQVKLNADAGITLALYDTALFPDKDIIELELYNQEDSIDNITISRSIWGIYRIFKSAAHWKNYKIVLTTLAGADLSDTEPIALYMADMERYLSLSGNTRLTGNCHLPKVGVKTAYIEGQNYTGDKLVYGEIKNSSTRLPDLPLDIISANLAYFRDTIPASDSLVSIEEIMDLDTLNRSFTESTLVISSAKSITLDAICLSGNIRIISSTAIYVSYNTTTENIILYAPSIYFEAGFRGSLQAFAQDSLVAGNNCEFEYPSALCLINENINGIFLELGESTQLTGTVILYQNNRASNEPYLKIGDDARIHGQVYCPGKVEIKGTIEGSLFCHGFMLRTTSGLFENHLFNVEIDRSALSDFYAGSLLFKGYQHTKSIQWLN